MARPAWALGARPKKRSLSVAGHPTSVSLEALFWDRLKALAELDGLSLAALVAQVDEQRSGSLSAALRCYVLHREIEGRGEASLPTL